MNDQPFVANLDIEHGIYPHPAGSHRMAQDRRVHCQAHSEPFAHVSRAGWDPLGCVTQRGERGREEPRGKGVECSETHL